MTDFKRASKNSIIFRINTQIFNDTVITKTLYWLSGEFNIYQESSGYKISVKLEKREGNINKKDLAVLKAKINQDLIDFKTRDIVNQETKNIREIILVNAFANNDDFEDYNLITI